MNRGGFFLSVCHAMPLTCVSHPNPSGTVECHSKHNSSGHVRVYLVRLLTNCTQYAARNSPHLLSLSPSLPLGFSLSLLLCLARTHTATQARLRCRCATLTQNAASFLVRTWNERKRGLFLSPLPQATDQLNSFPYLEEVECFILRKKKTVPFCTFCLSG